VIRDAGERELSSKAGRIAVLKKYLEPLWGAGHIARHTEAWIVLGVMSVVGAADTDFLDRIDAADRRLAEAATVRESARSRAPYLPSNVSLLVLESAETRLQGAALERESLDEYTLKKEVAKVASAANREATDSEDEVADLERLEAEGRSKLKGLEAQARPAALTAEESRIIAALDRSVQLEKRGQPGPAAERLAEATRLWRREMARQFESRVRD
jgi:hypothetical protein